MVTIRDVHSSAELYRLISKEDLHLRSGDGRDDALIKQLAVNLGLNPKSPIPKQLEKNKVSLEEFIQEFFLLGEPFSKMYNEIFKIMEQQRIQSSENSIRMRFSFDRASKKLEFDLKHFREWLQTYQRFEGVLNARLWTQQDINKLYRPIDELEKIFGVVYERNIETHYPCTLPDPSLLDIDADWKPLKQLRVALERLKKLQTQQEIYSETKAISILREKQNSEEQTLPIRTRLNLTDIWPGVFRLLLQLQSSPPSTVPDAAKDSLQKIKVAINEVETNRTKANVIVKRLIELLRLPFWKYRWRLYEVWTLFKLIEGLDGYDCKLESHNGKILLVDNKPSNVAHFTDSKAMVYNIWTQLKTAVANPLSRKHIMPDIRVTELDASLPQNTFIIVECKQRKQMEIKELKELVGDYQAGTMNNALLLFVNYDDFPSFTPAFSNARLISKLNPTNSSAIDEFNRIIKDKLINSRVEPSTPQLDALIFDVSDSMRGQYPKQEIGEACEQLKVKNPRAKIFFFNEHLLPTEMFSAVDLKTKLEGMISGGTNLSVSLQELARNYPNVKRVAVVTDGGYNRPLALSSSYDLVRELVIGDNFP